MSVAFTVLVGVVLIVGVFLQVFSYTANEIRRI